YVLIVDLLLRLSPARDDLRQLIQPCGGAAVDALGREGSVCSSFSGGNPDEEFKRLLDGVDTIDGEFSLFHRRDYFPVQRQVLRVTRGDNHPLRAGEAAPFAGFKKAFDLFIHAPDGLNFSELIDRAGDSQGLADREGREA